MQEVVPEALSGERVDRVIAMLTGISRADAASLIDDGGVSLGGRVVTTRSKKLRAGDVIEIRLPEVSEVDRVEPDLSVEVDVVYEDRDVIVIDKPAALVVHPGAGHARATLVNGLLARYPELLGVGDELRPGIVHRLDAGTSGLLVVARNADAYLALVAQLAARDVGRKYLALVLGHVESPAGLIDAPIGRSDDDPTRMAVTTGGREARTRYTVLARFSLPVELTEVECALETGRTHQIRVHLAAIGHPIAGDARYNGARPAFDLDRPYLHAYQLSFHHPATGARVSFKSALPDDLASFRAALS